MEGNQFGVNNLASINSKSLNMDTGILISFIEGAILDWRRLTSLTSTIKGLVANLDDDSAEHYLNAAANRLMIIQEIILLEKSKTNLEDSPFPTLTQPMRVALNIEIKRFRDYYKQKIEEIDQRRKRNN